MMTKGIKDEGEARIYVGTYRKYNAGSLSGRWLDLETYEDKESFLAACKELHKDEADPELMFQDYEGFPRTLYSESFLDDRLWDFLALDDDERQIVTAYWEHGDSSACMSDILEAYSGTYDSEEAWAQNWLEDTGTLEEVPDCLRYHINYETFARDAQPGGDMLFAHANGEVLAFHSI